MCVSDMCCVMTCLPCSCCLRLPCHNCSSLWEHLLTATCFGGWQGGEQGHGSSQTTHWFPACNTRVSQWCFYKQHMLTDHSHVTVQGQLLVGQAITHTQFIRVILQLVVLIQSRRNLVQVSDDACFASEPTWLHDHNQDLAWSTNGHILSSSHGV